jgi:hypothetical protein
VSEELAARSLVARLVRDSGNYDESIKAFKHLVQRAKEVSNREAKSASQIDLVESARNEGRLSQCDNWRI